MRERTPRQLALLSAFIVSICLTIIALLTREFSSLQFGTAELVLVFGCSFVLVGIVVYIILERVINSKLKIIYRIIHGAKEVEAANEMDMSEEIFQKAKREALKFAKESREEIERLKVQAAFRREFIGNLAHELRTPIFNVQGYLHTLLEGGLIDENINEDYLNRADKNLDRLIELVKDLDTITKLESDADALNLEKVDLVELCEDVMEAAEMKAKSRKIKLKFDKTYDPLYVTADAGKIDQVFTNLIMNSINYGRENGETRVSFHNMGENVLVEVQDNGLGISEDNLPRIFERFYRVEKSRDRHKGGSGLGLAIVKHILEAHKQNINVTSSEGEGSNFSFTLERA